MDSRLTFRKKQTDTAWQYKIRLDQEKKWLASIWRDGRNVIIGRFDNEVMAAEARDRQKVEFYGRTAKLNFPDKINEYLNKL